MFRVHAKDKISLIKRSGEVISDILAMVQRETIFIEDVSLPIEEGDIISRDLPSGLTEKYIVIDRGFYEAFASFPARYQVKVEKQPGIKKQESPSIVLHASGPQSRINIGSTDHSTNLIDGSITENNVFEKLRETIEQQVTGEEKEAILISVEQLEQTKGTSKYISAYQSFIQNAKDWMTIIGPFIPILTTGLQG